MPTPQPFNKAAAEGTLAIREINMAPLLEHARAPKQTRSRQSFDRVLDAATRILAENGFSGLTLTQVNRQSRVSIGSIYCRVDSKEDLVGPCRRVR